MDIQSLFSINTIFHSVVTGVVVYMIRIFCESKWLWLIDNRKWRGLALPSIAIVVSTILVLFSGLSPDFLIHGKLIDKLGYAIICSFASGFLFSALKSMLQKEADK